MVAVVVCFSLLAWTSHVLAERGDDPPIYQSIHHAEVVSPATPSSRSTLHDKVDAGRSSIPELRQPASEHAHSPQSLDTPSMQTTNTSLRVATIAALPQQDSDFTPSGFITLEPAEATPTRPNNGVAELRSASDSATNVSNKALIPTKQSPDVRNLDHTVESTHQKEASLTLRESYTPSRFSLAAVSDRRSSRLEEIGQHSASQNAAKVAVVAPQTKAAGKAKPDSEASGGPASANVKAKEATGNPRAPDTASAAAAGASAAAASAAAAAGADAGSKAVALPQQDAKVTPASLIALEPIKATPTRPNDGVAERRSSSGNATNVSNVALIPSEHSRDHQKEASPTLRETYTPSRTSLAAINDRRSSILEEIGLHTASLQAAKVAVVAPKAKAAGKAKPDSKAAGGPASANDKAKEATGNPRAPDTAGAAAAGAAAGAEAGAKAGAAAGAAAAGGATVAAATAAGVLGACVPEGPVMLKAILQFYLLLYFVFALAYAFVKYDVVSDTNNILEERVKAKMKAFARHLSKNPIMLPMAYCFCFFFVADIVAQSMPAYWCDGKKHFDLRSSIAVGAASAIFHGLVLTYVHDKFDIWLDARPSVGSSAAAKMLFQQFVFCALYLPLTSIAFDGVAGSLLRFQDDVCGECAAAAMLAFPANAVASTALGLNPLRLVPTVTASALFWAPSHLFTYVVLSRWSPEARAPADAVIAFFWNVQCALLAMKNGAGGVERRTAVGPLLTGLSPGPAVSVPAPCNCKVWCASAVLGRLAVHTKNGLIMLKNAIVWLSIKIKDITVWIIKHIYWFTVRTLKIIWFIICTAIRSAITITLLLSYFTLMIVWTIVGLPFVLWDNIKWYIMLPFIPSPFPYWWKPWLLLWPWSKGQKVSSFFCCNPFKW
eukprot:TRINITY_DN14344_c1_g1_i2.p1 TRINITY_DN14344_c1_g1~~TRINITY_DN14344_c1_g1_i2.p1  ORF type:complete len:891 (+),score=117.26 TRINITY_DN14344_c1_g1_i2:149-2821(+)